MRMKSAPPNPYWRGVLQAVVSKEGARIDRRSEEMTFDQLYIEVPSKCRYVVVSVGSEFWLVDMYSAVRFPRPSTVAPYFTICLGSYSVHPTVDAAICAAVFGYEY